MNLRKLALLGAFALFGVVAMDAEAQACHKKKKSHGCNSCAAPVSPCGGCNMYAPVGPGSPPMVMPKPRAGDVVPGSEAVIDGYSSQGTYINTVNYPAPRRGLLRR